MSAFQTSEFEAHRTAIARAALERQFSQQRRVVGVGGSSGTLPQQFLELRRVQPLPQPSILPPSSFRKKN